MPAWLVAVFLFFSGTVTASGLMCYVWRTRHCQSLGGRSKCDWCQVKLPLKALIPVIGFFITRGKCGDCGREVPYYSLLSEILIGSLWAGLWLNNPELSWGTWLAFFLASAALVTIIISDFFWQEIPVRVLFPILVIVLALTYFQTPVLPVWWSALGGSLAAAGFFLWQYVLSRGKWVSGGDIWIGALSGALIGWNQVVLVTAVGYGGAAAYSLLCAMVKHDKRFNRVPLGSFLAWSTLIFLLAKLV